MLIKDLIKVTKSKKLELIYCFIEINAFITRKKISDIFIRRNPAVVYSEINDLAKRGILLMEDKPIFVGKSKARIEFKHYKINLDHPLVKILIR